MRINLHDPDAHSSHWSPITAGAPVRFKVVFGNERNTLFLRRALRALIQSTGPIWEVSFDRNTFDGIVKDSRSKRRPAVFST